MPIYKGEDKTESAYKGSMQLARIYKGDSLVYENYKTLTAEGIPPIILSNCKNTNMLGYEVYGNSVQGVPSGYTMLSYIQSTGTQYINTGFTPNQDTKVEIDFIMDDYTGKAIYGSRIAADNSTFSAMLQGQNNYSSFQYNTSAVTNTVAYTNGQSYKVVQDKNKLYVDGTLEHTFTYANFTCPGSLYLFSVNQNGTTPFFGKISVKSFKIWDNGILVRNFVPCKNPNNVIGMYDTVSGTFFQNAGTGTFTAGTVVPNPNNPVEIQSVGDKTKNLWNSTLIGGCMKFADGQYLAYPGYVCNSTPIPVEAGENYTISANNYDDPDLTSSGFVFYNNGSFVSSLITTSLTVTIPSGVNQLYYNFRKQSDPSTLDPSDITNVQLEKGSSATSYEPYGYRIPVTVSGRNLFDKTNSTMMFGGRVESDGKLYSQAYGQTVIVPVKPNTKYTINVDVSGYAGGSPIGRNAFYTEYPIAETTVGTVNSTTFYATYPRTVTTPANAKYWAVWVNRSQNIMQQVLNTLMIEEGETATSYKPYVAPRTSNIYLDEPLRKIGNGAPQPLPAGYTQVEYIQSSGTQYIDTGIKPNKNLKMQLVYSQSDQNTITGAYNSTSYRFQIFSGQDVTEKLSYRLFGSTVYRIDDWDKSNKNSLIFDIKNLQAVFNGNTYSITSEGSQPIDYNIYLFGANNAGSLATGTNGRIYVCKIYDNDKLVRNFIPCIDSNNVLGMYDTVNNVFYQNAGTGTFTAGRVVYADYIDFETQKVYRNVGSIDLGELTYTYQDNISRFRSSTIPNLKIVQGNWTYDLMCDIYGTTLAQNFNIGAQGGAAFIWDNRYTDATALENAVNGHILDYALNTPTEETITLPDILLNKGTNIISVGTTIAPSDMWIKYKGK